MKKNIAITIVAFAALLSLGAQAQTTSSAQDYDIYIGDLDGDGYDDTLQLAKDPEKPNTVTYANTGATSILPDFGIGLNALTYNVIIGRFAGQLPNGVIPSPRTILLQRKTAGNHYLLSVKQNGVIEMMQEIPNTLFGLDWSAAQHVIHRGDFNGDGWDDLFFQATSEAGTNAIVLRNANCAAFSTIAVSSGVTCNNGATPASGGPPHKTWSDADPSRFQGLKWSTKSAVVSVGDFDNDNRSDFFVRARAKIVLIDYEIPIPVPVHGSYMNGLVRSTTSLMSPSFAVGQLYNTNELGGLSPLQFNSFVGDFDGDGRDDLLLQSLTSGRQSVVLYGQANGTLASATALSSGLSWSADSHRIVVSQTAGSVATPSLILQALTPSGTTTLITGSVTGTYSQSTFNPGPTQPVTAVGRTVGAGSVSITGQASYTIPLELPAGIAGMTPKLSLAYSHGGGLGMLGQGWTVAGLSAITRCPATLKQDGMAWGIAMSITDRYCLDGNKLKLVDGSYGATNSTYRTEKETFSQIKITAADVYFGAEQFVVKGKDGRTYEYGTTNDSRVTVNVDGSTVIRTWALSKISDRSGNSIKFVYTTSGNGSYSISHIHYTERSGLSPAYSLVFTTQASTSGYDYQTSWTYGAQIGSGPLLSSIMLVPFSNLYPAPSSAIHSWNFSYRFEPRIGMHKPLLASIQECAASSGTLSCLAPTYLQWTTPTIGFGAEEGAWSASTPLAATIDMDADGYDDYVYADGTTIKVRWGSPAGLSTPDAFALSVAKFLTTDIDANGGTDLLAIPSGGGNWWSLRANTGRVLTQSDTGVPVLTGTGGQSAHAVVDYDGDGYQDIVQAMPGVDALLRIWLHESDGSAGFVTATPTPLDISMYQVTSLSTGLLGRPAPDFDGDGRQDLIIKGVPFGSTAVGSYVLNSGWPWPGEPVADSSWPYNLNADSCTDILEVDGSSVSARASSCRPSIYGSFGLPGGSGGGMMGTPAIGDWNGDGYEDVVYSTGSNNLLMLLSDGTNLGPADMALYFGGAADSRFMGDIDGNGRTDLLVSSSGSLKLRRNTATTLPGLMTSVTDGFGNKVSFSYNPATPGNCYTSNQSGAPAANTRPRGSYLACQMSTTDGTGGTYNQSFSYANARSEIGRGYAGFFSRSVTDSRTNVTVMDEFEQAFPFTGMSKHSIVTRSGGARISEVWNTPASVDYPSSSSPSTRYAYSSETKVETYEVDGPQNNTLIGRTTTSRTPDAFGNPVSTTVTTVDLDTDLDEDRRTFVVTTAHQITNDTDQWCLGQPNRSTVTKDLPDGDSHVQVETISRSIDYAACRVSKETIEPGATENSPTPLTVVTDFAYEPAGCGNPTAITVTGHSDTGTALPARATSLDYGSQCRFPETITNPLGQETSRSYRYDLGLLETETDPNDVTTKYQYDNFGRVKQVTDFYGTQIATSVTTDYLACNVGNNYCGAPDLRVAVATSTLDSTGTTVRTDTTYLDRLERQRISSGPLTTGEMSHVETRYSSRGLVASVSQPYTTSPTGRTVYNYDDIGRQTAAELRNSAEATVRNSSVSYEGRSVLFRNPRGHVTTKIYDITGQLRKSTDPSVSAPSTSGSTTYDYAIEAGGVLASKVTDAASNLSVVRTNVRGFKTQMVDPDMGTWNYTYNSLGELVKQIDANQAAAGTQTTFSYDKLSRMRTRIDAGIQTAEWRYDEAPTYSGERTAGRLTSVIGQSSYSEKYIFDLYGRPKTDRMTADGTQYEVDYAYQSLGLLDTLTYPQTTGARLAVKYEYQYGAAARVVDANSTSTVYWQLNAMNARGQVTEEQMGANGTTGKVQIATVFDPTTGLMSARQAGTQGGAYNRQNLSYLWDANGNLERRTDGNQGTLYEHFYYDELNRLDYSTLTAGSATTTNLDMSYDAIGNIKRKSDVSASDYNYTSAQSGCSYYSHAQPHAVRSAGSSVYCYDRNGNMMSRAGYAIAYDHQDMPTSISGAAGSSTFKYGPSGNRWKQVATAGGTDETTVYAWGLLEKVTYGTAGPTAYRHLIQAGEGSVLVTRWSNGTATQTHYVATDQIGSFTTITDVAGNLVSNASFDAFGKRRASNWQGATTSQQQSALTSVTPHGYTGHEHLDKLGLIHMNGRVQDPHLGRFLSADPHVQAPDYSQSLNRYSYVWNNPLRMTDPTGFDADPRCPDGSLMSQSGFCGSSICNLSPMCDASFTRGGLQDFIQTNSVPYGTTEHRIYAQGAGLGSDQYTVINRGFWYDGLEWTEIYSRGSLIGWFDSLGNMGGDDLRHGEGPNGGPMIDHVPAFGELVQASWNGALDFSSDVMITAVAGEMAGGVALPLLFRGFSAAATRLPVALTRGRNAQPGVDVYFGVSSGRATYCGISCDIGRRGAQHGSRFDLLELVTRSGAVTRGQARAIEESLIMRNPHFTNRIHSISPNHPWYGQAVKWGDEWLKANGF